VASLEAVPDERVEVLQRIYTAWETGGIDAVLELIDPEFEVVVGPEVSIEPDVYRGREGVRRWFDAFEGLEDVDLRPERFIDAGERVLVPVVLTGRGAGSGIEVEQRAVQVWTVRDGKAMRVEAFRDLESAREADR
jgi:ketosteroid isomerase-like protein